MTNVKLIFNTIDDIYFSHKLDNVKLRRCQVPL